MILFAVFIKNRFETGAVGKVWIVQRIIRPVAGVVLIAQSQRQICSHCSQDAAVVTGQGSH